MATPIEMPKFGNAVEECLLARWHRQPGETVAAGDLLADIETDKSTFELTTPVGGTLLAVFCQDGDVVSVYTTIAVVGTPGEPVDGFRPGLPKAAPESPATPAAASARPGQPGATSTAAIASNASMPGAAPPAGTAPAMSPRARHFAREHDFFPADVAGSGPGGRVLEADLRQLYDRAQPPGTAPAWTAGGAGQEGQASAAGRIALSGDPAATPVRLSLLRGTIARRMRQSLAATAQYTLNTSAVATGLLALRARIKSAGSPEDVSAVNINAMVLFCAIRALEAVPEINVEYLDGTIYQHANVHVGFACDTPRGLVVPVIRDSQRLTLSQLAARVKGLTARAQAGSIAPDELTGGTFTVSNLGAYGIESFSPILNPPQVAILGVNAIQLKPVRRGDGVAFVDHIGLSLTCDHQVVDGAPAARFLKTVRDQIERVESLAPQVVP